MLDIYLKNYHEKLSKKNCIIFFKGFDNSFFSGLNEYMKPLFNHEIKEVYFDLEEFKKLKKKMVSTLLQTEDGVFYGKYEELLLLKNNISLYEGEIYIIENNFNKYSEIKLNPKDKKIKDLLNSEEEKIKFKAENIEYEEFFGKVVLHKGKYYVIYINIDINEIEGVKKIFKLIPEYETLEMDSTISFLESSAENKDYYKLPNYGNDIELELLKIKIINKKIKNVNFVLGKKFTKYDKELQELSLIKKVCDLKGIKLNFYYENETIKKGYREDFTELLKTYWDSNKFRDLIFYKNPALNKDQIKISQGEIIEDIVKQVEKAKENKKFKDIFITSPTGSGKSIFFQIAALYLKEKYNYVTVIISPLKALMKDQIDNLIEKNQISGACFLNSDLSYDEKEEKIKKIKKGEISIVYLSPELLQMTSDLSTIIGDREIGLVVVDEAHTVSTWGKNFRVDYLFIGSYLKKIKKLKYKFPIVAMTATGVYNGPYDTVFEIVTSLEMKNPKFYIGKIKKENIKFKVRNFEVDKGSYELQKNEKLFSVIENKIETNEKTIFYFPYHSQVENFYSACKEEAKHIGVYTGRIDKTLKETFIDEFKRGEKNIILATKAFGMGVDIPDIDTIYHYAPSGDLSDYVQEIGRAARKKESIGYSEVDFNEKDFKYFRTLRALSGLKQWQLRSVLEKLFLLYKKNKMKANMLISPESFLYIFNGLEEKDLENKLKQALYFLEEDLEEKYGYKVFLARPRAFFSTIYVTIDKKDENKIIEKFSKFFKRISTVEENKRIKKVYNFRGEEETIIKTDPGDIFKFEIADFWIEHFSNYSYPLFIYRFFQGDIFQNNAVIPRIRLKIELENSSKETLKNIQKLYIILEETFMSFHKTFTKKEFEKSFKEKCTEFPYLDFKKVVNYIFSEYTYQFHLGKSTNKEKFLRSRKDKTKQIENYTFIGQNFNKVKNIKLKNFLEMFHDEEKVFSRYIPKDSKYLKVSYFVEAFGLGNYEVKGGNSPKIYIRINDPNKLMILSKGNYSNKILRNIEKNYRESEDILKYFFESKMDDNERWDFIENYFLGLSKEELMRV